MKILVTGGLGLIGHNIVQRLMHRGDDTVIMDIQTDYGIIPHSELQYLMGERSKKINNHPVIYTDISASGPVDYAIARERPEVIIHCASFPRQKVVNANPAWGADVMMRGLINLLESAKKYQVRRFVYVSSSMVYGDFEDQVTEDSPCNPQGQYGIMKLAGEWLVKDYARRCGFEYVIIRPSAVYGPLDVEDRVVAKFMIAAMNGGVLKVNGAGETLDFTYVDDIVDGLYKIGMSGEKHEDAWELGTGKNYSINEVANIFVKKFGCELKYIPNQKGNYRETLRENNDAMDRLGWKPSDKLEQYIKSL